MQQIVTIARHEPSSSSAESKAQMNGIRNATAASRMPAQLVCHMFASAMPAAT